MVGQRIQQVVAVLVVGEALAQQEVVLVVMVLVAVLNVLAV